MQINYKSNKNFIIKTKSATIQTDPVQINDISVDGPGEYEISDVMVEGIPLEDGKTIFLFKAEDINILHLDSLTRTLNNGELEKVNSTDILLVPVHMEEGASPKILDQLISQIDPRIVIPMDYQDTAEFEKAWGVAEKVPNLKMTKSALPEAERKTYILEKS